VVIGKCAIGLSDGDFNDFSCVHFFFLGFINWLGTNRAVLDGPIDDFLFDFGDVLDGDEGVWAFVLVFGEPECFETLGVSKA
jgi:hypothetical protein